MVTLADVKVDALTPRVKMLRERMRSAKSHATAERSRLHTLAWKQSENEPLDIRWARMFEKYLNETTISIKDGELILGSQTKYVIGASPYLAYRADIAKVLRDERFTMRGEKEEADITEEERRSLLEDLDYWTGRSVECKQRKRWQEIFGDKIKEVLGDSKAKIIYSEDGVPLRSQGGTLKWSQILNEGLRSFIADAEAEIARLNFDQPDDMERYNFLQATIISLRAAINLARRHAALAREQAERETDAQRKRELEEIAQVCDRVPEYPAETFRQAVQSYWFTFLCAWEEAGCTQGRIDQFLYPFYKKDIEAGRLTPDQAAELLACLWIKFNELINFQYQYARETTQGSLLFYATVGGFTPDGKDATNDLTFLILEVVRQLKLVRPSVAISYHPNVSEQLLMKAIDVNREVGGGIPAFLNVGVIADKLMDYGGISLEDARDISFSDCVHPHTSHTSAVLAPLTLNLAKIFELALHNGVDPRTGKQLGPTTGAPRTFQSFEEVTKAYEEQCKYWFELAYKLTKVRLLSKIENCRVPFHSALIDDCISRGRDVFRGGARYPLFEIFYNVRGGQNIGNSMVAIKKLVFEEKKISMAELLEAIDSNFEGREELRQLLLAQPKYGNDDDEVDSLVAKIWDSGWNLCQSEALHQWRRLPVMVRRGGATFHYIAGKVCGAFPDGRKAGEPMADGSVSAAVGTDRKGPTAVINSTSKLNPKCTFTSLFNMKFPPYLLKTEENKHKLLALIKTYFDRGGYHIQFNMISKETLLDAKAHPENYRDLVVRVAGFSAYFVDLVPTVQDDIIARTEHAL